MSSEPTLEDVLEQLELVNRQFRQLNDALEDFLRPEEGPLIEERLDEISRKLGRLISVRETSGAE